MSGTRNTTNHHVPWSACAVLAVRRLSLLRSLDQTHRGLSRTLASRLCCRTARGRRGASTPAGARVLPTATLATSLERTLLRPSATRTGHRRPLCPCSQASADAFRDYTGMMTSIVPMFPVPVDPGVYPGGPQVLFGHWTLVLSPGRRPVCFRNACHR